MVSASNSDQKSVEDSSVKFSAVKSIAELAEIHLQMLGAGAVIGAIDESLCVADHMVQPFEQLSIRIENFPFVIVAFGQRFSVCLKAVGLHRGSIGNTASGKVLNGGALDIGCQLHSQIGRITLVILGNCYKNCLVSSGTTTLTRNIPLFTCSKVRIVKFYDALQNITLIPHFHGGSDPAKEIPGSLIADLKLTCQGKGRDTALVTSHQVDRPEPLGQGQMAAVHNGVRHLNDLAKQQYLDFAMFCLGLQSTNIKAVVVPEWKEDVAKVIAADKASAQEKFWERSDSIAWNVDSLHSKYLAVLQVLQV